MAVWKCAAAAFESGRGVSKGARVGFICDLRVGPTSFTLSSLLAVRIAPLPSIAWSTAAEVTARRMSLSNYKTANVLYFSWEMANSLVIKALRQRRGIPLRRISAFRTAALLSDDRGAISRWTCSLPYTQKHGMCFARQRRSRAYHRYQRNRHFASTLHQRKYREKFAQDPAITPSDRRQQPGFVSHLPVDMAQC